MSFLLEFSRFLQVRKKYWLLPVLMMMVVFGGKERRAAASGSSSLVRATNTFAPPHKPRPDISSE